MLEGSTIFVQRLHEILHQTKLDVKRRKKHLIYVHQRILLEAMFARNKSASRPPSLSAYNAGIQLDYPRDRENNSTLWSPLAYPQEDQWPYLFRFLKLVILTSSWTGFHCLSREAKSSDCFFDRYKSWARSFRSSWRDPVWLIATCSGICRLNIFQIYWLGRILLEGISSSDEERRSLFTGGVGTGRSSEWRTGPIAHRRLGYLIFF